MNIDIISFLFGVIIALAVIIIFEKVYGKVFGNRRLRELEREVRRLQGINQKKDDLIKKSLKTIQSEEKKNNDQSK
ncbi:hypothetical protein JXQ31_09925 [candidate division KSB1 bacterium]|nr:hypothetical protein [candidate division KSB1 bacterium]